MAVSAFNRTIFVAPPGMVVHTLHAVVPAESSITLRQFAASVFTLLFPCRPQTVCFVLCRYVAQLSERFLQAFSQGREALTTQHDPHPAPVASFQAEVIQLMRQQLTSDGDNYAFQFGKVLQATQAGLMPLAEHHLLLCNVLQLPFADPPLHGSAETVGVLTEIFILQHFQQSRRHQSGSFLLQGNKNAVPYGFKRVFARPPVTSPGF